MKRAALSLLVALAASVSAQDDLTVLKPLPDGTTPDAAFEKWLLASFSKLTTERATKLGQAIPSKSACLKWQEERRTFFLTQIGGLPERTPLNPKITGTLQGPGYRIEKVFLETRPSFHLTGNLYLPETPAPWPAVLVPCGHSHDGKAAGQYQLISKLLARNGMAAFCYDPIGQGERYQLLAKDAERSTFEDAPQVKVPHPAARFLCITEHTLTTISSTLVGSNAAQFRIWDGMRVIDYLQSRSDIIADKIGCTGNSGGGTETAYLMALDDRILAAAPGCYLTSFKKLVEQRGPQDGEQNIFGQIAFGMDEADYCIMRAPKPTLICAGTRDVTFDFNGTMEVFSEAKRFYSRLGFPEHIDIAAPDAPHGFTLQLREAVARFMSRWLLGKDTEIREVKDLPDVIDEESLRAATAPDFTAQELQVTPKGQVLLEEGERSVFQINAEQATQLKANRPQPTPETIGATIGALDSPPDPEIKEVGLVKGPGFSIRKLELTIEGDFKLGGLLFQPAQSDGSGVLYLHSRSMKMDAGEEGPIERLVQRGTTVLSAELRGIGETATGQRRKAWGNGRFGQGNLEILTAYLMGKTYVGMRTDDVRSWAAALKRYSANITVTAQGEASLPTLHAAAIDPDLFSRVRLRDLPPPWETIVSAGETREQTANMVHGVLKHYDLPDLIEMAGANKVSVQSTAQP
jgi:dienelactone hydrolase